MNILQRFALAFALCVCGCIQDATARQISDIMISRIDSVFAEFDHDDTPGAAVSIVRDGEHIFSKGYGMANLEHGIPVSTSTLFNIGSSAKQFTALAILLLESSGTLSLDDDIRILLPETPDFGMPITIRNLVHHTSGLREIVNALVMGGWQLEDAMDHRLAMQLVVRSRELNFDPGAEHLYCNTGYALLADIIARASGEDFHVWMKSNIFDPLGMTSTVIKHDRVMIIPGSADSYSPAGNDRFEREFHNHDFLGGTNVWTTADDAAKWLAQFDRPVIGGEGIVERQYRRGVLASGDTLRYAFGLTHSRHRGLDYVGHGGSDAGYRAFFVRYPASRFSVAVMSNSATARTQNLANAVADLFLADEMIRIPRPPVSRDPETPVEVPVEPSILDRLVGEYELQIRPGFILAFTREDDRLFQQATGQGKIEVYPSSDSTFFFKVVTASVTFHRAPDDSVNRITLHQGGDFEALRVEKQGLPAGQLSAFAGTYFSPELAATYRLVIEEGKLMAHHQRHEPFELVPGEEDNFRGPWFFAQVRFIRDDSGEVIALRASNGRVRDMLFEKAE